MWDCVCVWLAVASRCLVFMGDDEDGIYLRVPKRAVAPYGLKQRLPLLMNGLCCEL